MKTIILHFEFNASHSLEMREEEHDHLWILTIAISGEPVGGFIFDLFKFRTAIEENILQPIQQTFLNKNTFLSANAQTNPTCESLSDFFIPVVQDVILSFKKNNSSLQLQYLEVALCEKQNEEQKEIGRVRTDF